MLWEDTLLEFIGVTVVLGGGAAWLTGRATALIWAPYWRLVVYTVLLTVALRFIHFSLFGGTFFLPASSHGGLLCRGRFHRASGRGLTGKAHNAGEPDGPTIRLPLRSGGPHELALPRLTRFRSKPRITLCFRWKIGLTGSKAGRSALPFGPTGAFVHNTKGEDMYKSLLASAAITLVMTGAARADLPIAVAGPMTGDYAVFGAQMQRGAEQAVEDINAAGGVLGEQLVLSVGDDACDARQAVSVANQFASDGVIFVAGHYCSGSSIPASQVYAEEQIVQISPASTNPAFTEERPGPGIFRVCGRDDDQGKVAGAYLAKNFADANIAIIHDRTAYGMGLAEQTRKYLNEAGKEETMFEAYTPGEQDYTALVTRMKNEGIDVVYVGGYHTEAGLIRRQMSQAGMTDAVLVSGDALLSEEYWAITGETGEGTLMSFAPDPRLIPAAAEITERFRAEGFEPEGYTLYTYATVQIWAQAVEAAGSTEFDAVVQALNDGTFDTVLGELSFDETGDTRLPYVFYEWSNGDYEQFTTIEGGQL